MKYFNLFMADSFVDGMDEGILFEAEGDRNMLIHFAGEVDSDCADWDGFLRFG